MRTHLFRPLAAAVLSAGLLMAPGARGQAERSDPAALRAEVERAERAFAKAMADRDLEAFGRSVAADAIFFSATPPLRGRAAVLEGWKRFFVEREAPLSWEPDEVEVLDSGDLAHTSGPVRNPQGVVVLRFNSVWRREAPGVWRVVFDRGERVCEAGTCEAARAKR